MKLQQHNLPLSIYIKLILGSLLHPSIRSGQERGGGGEVQTSLYWSQIFHLVKLTHSQ